MNLSIVVTTYKNKNKLIETLQHNSPFLVAEELIIVNDDPNEKIADFIIKKLSLPFVKKLVVINNEKNLGFGGAANRGVKKAQGKYVMILNDDVFLKDKSYQRAFFCFEKNPNLFGIGFLQEERNKNLVGKNIIFWKRGMFFHSKAEDLTFGLTGWAEGGAWIVDREKFLFLGGFDEIYSPFYWEDIDLCYRAYKNGWVVYFDPQIKVIHHHQSTIAFFFKKDFIEETAFSNQLIFIWKNITDRKLIFSHFFYLPFYFVRFLINKKGKIFVKGFLKAVKKLSLILEKRKLLPKKTSDRKIFEFFKQKDKKKDYKKNERKLEE